MAIFILLPKYGIPRIFYGLAFFWLKVSVLEEIYCLFPFSVPNPFLSEGNFSEKGK
jgi:hypothetical protein